MRRPSRLARRVFGIAALSLLASTATSRAEFANVALSSGIFLNDVTWGIGWGDLDGDDDLDLVVSRHFAGVVVYWNLGNGKFNRNAGPQPFVISDHHGFVVTSLDGDDDPDVYFTGGAHGGLGGVDKHFYRNDGGATFTNIAFQAGLEDSVGRGRGVSAIDADNDGDVDLFVAKAKQPQAPNSLFIQDGTGTGTFTDMAQAAGVDDDFGSVGGIWGDYDRDGDPDLLISGEEDALSETRLYRNDGNLSFVDVASTVLPATIDQLTAAAWGDYDKDGDLDLAVGEGDEGLFDAYGINGNRLHFFFHTRTGDDGVDKLEFTQTDSSGTFSIFYTGDFDPDFMYLSSLAFNPITNPFTYTEGEIAGVPPYTPGASLGLFAGTENGIWKQHFSAPVNFGKNLAGFITIPGSFTQVNLLNTEARPVSTRGTRVLRNDGGVFVDVSASLGIDDSANVRMVTWVDYDLDGDLDLHVLDKGDVELLNGPDLLYRNDGGTFVDVATELSITGPTNGLADACAFEDYDDDGDLDVAMTSGSSPRFFAVQQHHSLYRNDQTTGNASLRIDLLGTLSPPDGLGAWVTCVSSQSGRQTTYVAANSWRGSAVMRDPFFGLGSDTMVDSLIVEWSSGNTDVITDLPVPGKINFIEGLGVPTDVVDGPIVAQGALRVVAVPNPARTRTTLRIEGRGGSGTLEIIDTAGRRIFRREVTASQEAAVEWNGRDTHGQNVATGVYYARWIEAEQTTTSKFIWMR